jgi:hypothetical protein
MGRCLFVVDIELRQMFVYLLWILNMGRCLFVVDIELRQMFVYLLWILDMGRCSCICCGYQACPVVNHHLFILSN